jgi:methionyl-tRNA formyltransferase
VSLRIVFMGTPAFAVPPLEALASSGHTIAAVVSQPDRPSGRKMKVTPTPVHSAADRLGLPHYQPEKIRTEAYLEWLSGLQPDLFVTAAYGRILTPQILSIPRYGCLNIHASLLPKHRGASPVNASIIQGDRSTGITFMLTEEGMDTGDILYQESIAIPEDMDAGALSDRLSLLGASRVVSVIDAWVAGTLRPVPQDHSQATSTKPMKRDDGKIDWSMSATEIHNLVRGTLPGRAPLPGWTQTGKNPSIQSRRRCRNPADMTGVLPGTILDTCPACIGSSADLRRY